MHACIPCYSVFKDADLECLIDIRKDIIRGTYKLYKFLPLEKVTFRKSFNPERADDGINMWKHISVVMHGSEKYWDKVSLVFFNDNLIFIFPIYIHRRSWKFFSKIDALKEK